MNEEKNINDLSFDECIGMLDRIIRELEGKGSNLEEAVTLYSKALDLSKRCNEILNTAEKTVVQKMTELGLQEFKVSNEN